MQKVLSSKVDLSFIIKITITFYKTTSLSFAYSFTFLCTSFKHWKNPDWKAKLLNTPAMAFLEPPSLLFLWNKIVILFDTWFHSSFLNKVFGHSHLHRSFCSITGVNILYLTRNCWDRVEFIRDKQTLSCADSFIHSGFWMPILFAWWRLCDLFYKI